MPFKKHDEVELTKTVNTLDATFWRGTRGKVYEDTPPNGKYTKVTISGAWHKIPTEKLRKR